MRKKLRRRSMDLDITPLIDVMFMLIIFFVLTASFVQGSITVDLPSGSGTSSDSADRVILTVEEDGKLLWDGKSVSLSELRALARSVSNIQKTPKKEVLVAGDKKASYGAVAEILSILKEEGIISAGLMMQGEGGAKSDDFKKY